MAKILVAEDDVTVALMVEQMLLSKRHIIDVVDDGKHAIDLLRSHQYELLIVDWGLPTRTGPEICQWYRASGGTGKILFLTGHDTIDDKEHGYTSGADDYLTKPFDLRELVLRVDALLRRPEHTKPDIVQAGKIAVDRQKMTALRDGVEISLTDMDFALLEFFIANPNRVFTNKMILEHVWPADSDRSADTIRIAINKLRKKIDVDNEASIIKNVHGRGYMLES